MSRTIVPTPRSTDTLFGVRRDIAEKRGLSGTFETANGADAPIWASSQHLGKILFCANVMCR